MVRHPQKSVRRLGSSLTAELDENTAVSIDLDQSTIEIECIVVGDDVVNGLANGKLQIHDMYKCADLPVKFIEDRRPCASEWRIVDESAETPELATA